MRNESGFIQAPVRERIKTGAGFTLIELILVVGIALIIFGFITINLVNVQKITSINASTDSLVSDMTSQQTKAMQGSGSISDTSYGIHFQSDRYILFRGNVFSGGDSSNYTVMLDQGITFTDIRFPGNSVVYASRSGEVSDFSSGNDSVTIYGNQGSNSETVTVNKYGVVIGVN